MGSDRRSAASCCCWPLADASEGDERERCADESRWIGETMIVGSVDVVAGSGTLRVSNTIAFSSSVGVRKASGGSQYTV